MPEHEFFTKYASLPIDKRRHEISLIRHPGITPLYIHGTLLELNKQINTRKLTKERLLEVAKLLWK